jgi:flavodoxin short chain
MKKIAVVYWSGTGNTEQMANMIAEGARGAGAEVTVFTAGAFDKSMVENYDAIAFGCSSMGAEVLEEQEFEPMYASCKEKLSGKTVALFGSYGWGDGEWMRDWEQDIIAANAVLPCGYLIINETPDDAGNDSCKKLGIGLAKA